MSEIIQQYKLLTSCLFYPAVYILTLPWEINPSCSEHAGFEYHDVRILNKSIGTGVGTRELQPWDLFLHFYIVWHEPYSMKHNTEYFMLQEEEASSIGCSWKKIWKHVHVTMRVSVTVCQAYISRDRGVIYRYPCHHFSPALYCSKYAQSNNVLGIINPRAPIGSNWHLLEGCMIPW